MNGLTEYWEHAAKTYHDQIGEIKRDHDVMGYLNEHAIDAFKTINAFRLGAVLTPLPGDEAYAGCLAIPYLTPSGVRGMKYRYPNPGKGQSKYGQHHGQRARLYNTRAYFEATHDIGITEGEIDAIAATAHLGLPTMGVPGAQQWKGNAQVWSVLFKDFTRVFVFQDGDSAGVKFTQQIAESLGWRVKVIECAPGEDVASTVHKGERTTLLTRIYDE